MRAMALLAEGAFGQVGLDAHLGGGHQLVHWAAVGDAMQFFTLGVGEHALEGQLDVQRVLAFLLLAVVVLDLDRDAGERNLFSARTA